MLGEQTWVAVAVIDWGSERQPYVIVNISSAGAQSEAVRVLQYEDDESFNGPRPPEALSASTWLDALSEFCTRPWVTTTLCPIGGRPVRIQSQGNENLER